MTRVNTTPPRYEIVRKDGEISPMKFDSAVQAAEAAKLLFPDQSQDEERTGRGWDVQLVGCDR